MLSAEDWSSVRRRALAGTAAGIVAALAVRALADAAGVTLQVTGRGSDPTTVPLGAIVLATVVGGAGAYGLARLAGRTAGPRRTFLLAALAGLLVSSVPPLAGAVDTRTALWLLAMHAGVAAAVVPAVASALPARPPARV